MKAKINLLRAILSILLLAVFLMIFKFSGQDGEKSGSLSREITENLTKNVKYIQQLEESKKEEVLGKIEHFIRKLAHFSLYTLVGILAMSLMSTYDWKQRKRMGISFAIGFLYAILDEIHQSFIPGRAPLVGDILIDSLGVVVGTCIVLICLMVVKRIKHTSKIRQTSTINDKFT